MLDMTTTNNAEAGPSSIGPKLTKRDATQLELAGKVEVYKSSTLEDVLDYSILVNNSVSMARDQLANERNWLTWFRLSCTLIILGFTVLAQIRLPDGSGQSEEGGNSEINNADKPIGYVFCGIGFLCFFLGLGKYFKNQRLLVKQATYVEAGWGSYLVVAILFLFVCTVMILSSVNSAQSLLVNTVH